MKRLGRKTVVTALVAASAGSSVIFGAAPANAANPSAQVRICNTTRYSADPVTVDGYNQNATRTLWGPYSIAANTCGQTTNYWWGVESYVLIRYVIGGESKNSNCFVPENAGSVVTCYIS